MKPALFFDRDGTLMVDKDYLADPAGVELFPDTVEALRMANSFGYLCLVLSNQSGVARGLMSVADVAAVNSRLVAMLKEEGVELDGIYFCPHHPDYTGPCDCRKPARGMADQAARRHRIDLARSWVVGDTEADIGLAFNIGAGAVLVRTGSGAEVARRLGGPQEPDYIAAGVLDAVEWIGKNGRT